MYYHMIVFITLLNRSQCCLPCLQYNCLISLTGIKSIDRKQEVHTHLRGNMTLKSVQQQNELAISTACSQEILTVASPVHRSLTLDFYCTWEWQNIKYRKKILCEP
jgi:hypothetical protein